MCFCIYERVLTCTVCWDAMQLNHHIRVYYISLGSGTTWTRQVLPTDDLKYGHQIVILWTGLAQTSSG
jgi:hypothetical protein